MNTFLKQASQLIATVKGKSLSRDERGQKAVDLAAALVLATRKETCREEKNRGRWLARMLADPQGRAFLTEMTDQCFRSHSYTRTANQLNYLLKKYGIPKSLRESDRFKFLLFHLVGESFPSIFVPQIKKGIRKEFSNVLLPEEPEKRAAYFSHCRKENIRINLNHLGEAILGEGEAKRRLELYLNDLDKPEIEYISVKISTLFSQINVIGWEKTLETLASRLRLLYRKAQTNCFRRADGRKIPKFVNLDMEEYKDVDLTVALFQKVLSEPEFHSYQAGIVLQSYLPNSFLVQKQLTHWAMERVSKGGAPIKIRLVKGANLALETVESSIKGWEKAPFLQKIESDANLKRMLEYAAKEERLKAVYIGLGSHNLFDIAYSMILKAERNIESEISFEMLEGMAEPMRRVVQQLSGSILLYCPDANKKDFQNAIAYLIRRLDENSGPDNFLRHFFEIEPENVIWKNEEKHFLKSLEIIPSLSQDPRRTQNRLIPERKPKKTEAPFSNEPDTDFSLPENRTWATNILSTAYDKTFPVIPLVIGGESILMQTAKGTDPSRPHQPAYEYVLANEEAIQKALKTSKTTSWKELPFEERNHILANAAQQFRLRRDQLIGVMIVDAGKTIEEADPEVSEAIDFIEYYRKIWERFLSFPEFKWSPKGTILVASPWNFPCSIPAGGIAAALTAGNSVLFKPAPEAVLVGWELINCFWDAGVPKQALQFINCQDDPTGTNLIKNSALDGVILTGATATAHFFMQSRPDLDLHAETGGKNSMILTAMCDRDLAVRDLVQSAFGYSGQKCSACSLAILEAELYDDPLFQRQLKEAVESLPIGSSWNPTSKITPLIRPPQGALLKGLTELEKGEHWILKPSPDKDNPHLWSPGIKYGVRAGSFMHQTELFGPVLGVMRAESLEKAIQLANSTPYGLTSGIHTLDEREQEEWKKRIIAGNLYINRGITGSIVRRQPFGGCKASRFGFGAKTGGPNYVFQFAKVEEISLPLERASLPPSIIELAYSLKLFNLKEEEVIIWKGSAESYAYWIDILLEPIDPSCLIGQRNYFFHTPLERVYLRFSPKDSILQLLQVAAACKISQVPLEISCSSSLPPLPKITTTAEEEAQFIERIPYGSSVRLLSKGSTSLQTLAAERGIYLESAPVLANGRLELLNYLQEIALSFDYHRYGYLGKDEP